MNQSAKPPRAAGARWAGVRLALSLLPVVAISAPSVAPEPADSISRPYLASVGSPAIRFGEAIPPPDLSVRPAAAAPPQPADELAPPLVEPVKGDVTAMPPAAKQTEPAAAADIIKAAAPGKPPAAILPDDTRPKVHAEDFLPFFQFPGGSAANGDVTVVAPVPNSAPTAAPLPASSATYRQQ